MILFKLLLVLNDFFKTKINVHSNDSFIEMKKYDNLFAWLNLVTRPIQSIMYYRILKISGNMYYILRTMIFFYSAILIVHGVW